MTVQDLQVDADAVRGETQQPCVPGRPYAGQRLDGRVGDQVGQTGVRVPPSPQRPAYRCHVLGFGRLVQRRTQLAEQDLIGFHQTPPQDASAGCRRRTARQRIRVGPMVPIWTPRRDAMST